MIFSSAKKTKLVLTDEDLKLIEDNEKDSSIDWHYVWFRTNAEIRNRGYTWNKVCRGIPISLKTWMSGLPTEQPTKLEILKIAKFIGADYNYLMYGDKANE
jgi:hypothetical protein